MAYRYRSPFGRRDSRAVLAAAGLVLGLAAVGASHHGGHHHPSHGHGRPAATTTAAPSRRAAAVAVARAKSRIGCPYLWGGTGPCSSGYDCSGLVMDAYAAAGVSIPRTSEEQWAGLRHVPWKDRRAGDLVFFAGSDGTPAAPGHVALVTGPHSMIEAYAPGYPVRASTYGLPSSAPGDQAVVGVARP